MHWGIIMVGLVACESAEGPVDEATIAPDDVTYADVEPILAARCIGCHSSPPRNGAPFSLTSFDDAASRADRIVARAVDADPSAMPPGGVVLSAEQELVLIEWAESGAPR